MRALLLSLTLALTACDAPCTLGDGTELENGESAPAGDGCNTCTCDNGELACTLIGCVDSGDSGQAED